MWRLLLFFIPGSNQQAATFGPYLALIVVFTFLFTWLHNNANRSILVAIIFHTMMDLTLLVIFPVAILFPFFSAPVLFMYVSMVGILVAIVAVSGSRQLVRK